MKRSILILFCLIWSASSMAQIRLGQSRYASTKPVNILELNYAKPQKFRIAEIKAVGLSTLDEVAIISLSLILNPCALCLMPYALYLYR